MKRIKQPTDCDARTIGEVVPGEGIGPLRLTEARSEAPVCDPQHDGPAVNWRYLPAYAAAFPTFAILAGCAVGPNYKAPQTTVAGSFANSPTNATSIDEAALATWWKGFNDAKLDRLVE